MKLKLETKGFVKDIEIDGRSCRLESGKVIPEQVLRTIIKENMIEKW
jgi:hypothetical protein